MRDKDRAITRALFRAGKCRPTQKHTSETHRTSIPLASLDSIREPRENFCRVQGLECQAFASGSIEIRCKGRAKVENDFKHVITRPFGENYRRAKRREARTLRKERDRTEGKRRRENEDRFTKSSSVHSHRIIVFAAKSAGFISGRNWFYCEYNRIF